jgi:hypothetical protein
LGPDLVDRLDLSELARDRLRAIFETVIGTVSVKDACAKLGITETHFHNLRREALEAAGESLEPQAPGRKPKVQAAPDGRLQALQQENHELKVHVEAMRLREEIAVIAPHLLERTSVRLRPGRSYRLRGLVGSAGKSGTSRS